MSAVFELCQERLAEYTAAASEGLDICTALKHQDTCDALQAATLREHLTLLGFHPVQRDPDTRSIDEIIAAFAVGYDTVTPQVDKAHASCCATRNIDEDVRDLVEDTAGLRLADFMRCGVECVPDYGGGMVACVGDLVRVALTVR